MYRLLNTHIYYYYVDRNDRYQFCLKARSEYGTLRTDFVQFTHSTFSNGSIKMIALYGN